MANAVNRQEVGINVLLYGPPGTGKTELAKVVAQSAGLELFEVEYADRDGNSLSGRDRYRSLQIAQVFLKGSAQAALLFDEVEDVFPPAVQRGRPAHGARRRKLPHPAQRQRQRQSLGQPGARIQRGAHHLGDQPHRAD
jgi:ABC-type iron transport system FetAB ATPase subunit